MLRTAARTLAALALAAGSGAADAALLGVDQPVPTREAAKDGIRDYYLDDPEQFKTATAPGDVATFLDDVLWPDDLNPVPSNTLRRRAWQTVKEKAIQDLEAVKDGIRDYYLDDPEQFKSVIVPGLNSLEAPRTDWAVASAASSAVGARPFETPEPTGAALLAAAALGAGSLRRRRPVTV